MPLLPSTTRRLPRRVKSRNVIIFPPKTPATNTAATVATCLLRRAPPFRYPLAQTPSPTHLIYAGAQRREVGASFRRRRRRRRPPPRSLINDVNSKGGGRGLSSTVLSLPPCHGIDPARPSTHSLSRDAQLPSPPAPRTSDINIQTPLGREALSDCDGKPPRTEKKHPPPLTPPSVSRNPSFAAPPVTDNALLSVRPQPRRFCAAMGVA